MGDVLRERSRVPAARLLRDQAPGAPAPDRLSPAAARDRPVRRADDLLDLPARAVEAARPRPRRARDPVCRGQPRGRDPGRVDRHRGRAAREAHVVTGLLVIVCGGAGATARFVVDRLVEARRLGEFPWGTAAVNLSGTFALGLLTGLSAPLTAEAGLVTSELVPASHGLGAAGRAALPLAATPTSD